MCYNGWVHQQGSLLNGGSLYSRSGEFFFRTKQKQSERQEFVKGVQVADDSVVVIKSEPEKFW